MSGNHFTSKLLDVVVAKKEDQTLKESTGIFLVMDYIQNDIKKMLDDIQPADLSEDHIKIIIYNLVCGLNFIHSANLMHRDIKPQNILINTNCQVIICDFGLSRTVPRKSFKDLFQRAAIKKQEVGSDSETEDSTPQNSDELKKSDIVGKLS